MLGMGFDIPRHEQSMVPELSALDVSSRQRLQQGCVRQRLKHHVESVKSTQGGKLMLRGYRGTDDRQ